MPAVFHSDLAELMAELTGQAQDQPKTGQSTVLAGKQVLLVEDNEINLEIAAALLQDIGAVITAAPNGQEAVARFTEAPEGFYDLILMDIQMPIMDGYKATRAIRRFSDKKKAGIPIVAMTANAFTEDKERALESGMNDHVAKPIDMKVLMSVLEEQICGHKGL